MLLKMERISWLKVSIVQASSRPEPKDLGVQSPSVQSAQAQESRVQASNRYLLQHVL